ncbi:hypothetical protein LZ554_003388 [Drepanopeziza brunnea f. sp. 'monogermtubi']|nr:hypothetical protein LZ554_003388 [Drepanopeziza brunnea f. sp. 'monogermtubi']
MSDNQESRDIGSCTLLPSASSKIPALLRIPYELWDMIIRDLDLEDIKSVRASWRPLHDIASRYLCKPMFVFRRDRKDFERFGELTKNPRIIEGIQTLRFEIGEMGIFFMANWLGSSYSFMNNYYQSMIDQGRRDDGVLTKLRSRVENASLEYAKWNSSVHWAHQNYQDAHRLTQILNSATAVKNIQVTRKSITWANEDLLDSWKQGTHTAYMQKANEEFKTLLLCIQGSRRELQSFKHDEVPVTFFSSLDLENFIPAFHHLRTIHLSFNATETPKKVFWTGLGTVLCAIPGLEDLRLGFSPLEGRDSDMNLGAWQNSNDHGDWYVPLWKVFGDHTWKRLKRLRLEGMVFCEEGLSGFLGRHATLKSLELSGMALWQGSFEGLFHHLRNALSLESCHVWGLFQELQTSHEAWFICPSHLIFTTETEIWPASFTSHMQGIFQRSRRSAPRCLRPDLGSKLEDFLVSDGVWPLEMGETVPEHIREQPFRPDPSNKDEICQKWDLDLASEQADDRWEHGWGVDGDLNYATQEEILEVYSREGYDTYGFDKAGYDAGGIHHTKAAVPNWPNLDEPLHEATARRTVLAMIRDRIARIAHVVTSG